MAPLADLAGAFAGLALATLAPIGCGCPSASPVKAAACELGADVPLFALGCP